MGMYDYVATSGDQVKCFYVPYITVKKDNFTTTFKITLTEKTILIGDVNSDGVVNILDATEIVSNKEFATYLDGRSLASELRAHLNELDLLTGERDARLRGERFA